MTNRISVSQLDALMAKLKADDVIGAIGVWGQYCRASGECQRAFNHQMPAPLYCATMMHACLLFYAIGGIDAEHEIFHHQAQKVERWISQQPLS